MRFFLPAALALAVSLPAAAQTTYIPLGSPEYELFDRLETKSGGLSNDVFSGLKGLSRKSLVQFLEGQKNGDSLLGVVIRKDINGLETVPLKLQVVPLPAFQTRVDRFQTARAIGISGEWAADGDGFQYSRKPVLKHFYKTQSDLFQVLNKDFFLSVNPVIGLQGMYEKTRPERTGESSFRYLNSRGVEVRGRIANRVGFYTYFTDNQERMPLHVQDWTEAHQAVPNADYYQQPKASTYDYLIARGYIDFAAVKNHINITAGYDHQFIGDGERSLFLSDFASSGAAFLRLRTRIWRLMYQNLYMELVPQYTRGADQQLPHKYATIHHLSVNATRWLNVGLFEGVVFDRADRYPFSYMNPIILYRQVERAAGSPDNALLGLSFKAIAAKRLQFYGQFLLDEFKFSELKAGNGWIGNKFGVQVGAKYFDAFGISNLDLQGEVNAVRPFTYSHSDTLANYTHYNQPLAHPLESGFVEVIGNIRYRPANTWLLHARGSIYRKGADTAAVNLGNSVFRSNAADVPGQYGYGLISGPAGTVYLADLHATWEPKPRLALDLGVAARRQEREGLAFTSAWAYTGLRLNIARRDYQFY